jgi:hypothetical protein
VASQKDLEAAENKLAEVKEINTEKIKELEKQREEALLNGSQFSTVTIDAQIAKLEAETAAYEGEWNKRMSAHYEAASNYGEYSNRIIEYETAQGLILSGKADEAIEMLKRKGNAHNEYAATVDEETAKVLADLEEEAVQTGIQAAFIKSQFENGVAGYTEEMVKESEDAHTKAMAAWEGTYKEAYGVGENAGEGLKQGLEAKKISIVQRFKNAAIAGINAMKAALDEHSPSKKTMQIGVFAGEGLGIGIENTTPEVVTAAEELADASMAPLKASLEGVEVTKLTKVFAATPMSANAAKVPNNNEILKAKDDKPVTVQLTVDKKVLGEVSINSINDITKATGNLPLAFA